MRSGSSDYPKPEHLEMPFPDEVSPDQEYAHGWAVQHNRLWVALAASCLLNVGLMVWGGVQARNFKPQIVRVTLQGNKVVDQIGSTTRVDGVAYRPVDLERVLREYLDSRFAYDYEHPARLNDALRHLDDKSAEVERRRLSEAFIRDKILTPQTRVRLEVDYDNMNVVPGGNGDFEVTVPATVRRNTAAQFPDPNSPEVTQRTLKLRVATVEKTRTNPDGYLITGVPDEILP